MPQRSPTQTRKYAWLAVSAMALLYALFAGLRTVGDPDLGWQLATGRWILDHRAIPTTDVLSYTAAGREWIYPVLSQVILYCSYLLGGYPLLSWIGALFSMATIALLLRGGVASKALAVVAVPLIAAHTLPRSEMFSAVLFAAFVSILWKHHKSGSRYLWLLPLLMCLWVNLHLAFIAGLGMCAAYVGLELGEAVFGDRSAAFNRLRRAMPWLLATLAATILNPWGPGIFLAIVRQSDVLRFHNIWIQEWKRTPLTLSLLSQALAWRDPRSALWWLIAAALLAMVIAIWKKRIAIALLLGASVYLSLHSVRLEASFACVVVVIGGSIISDVIEHGWPARAWERIANANTNFRPFTFAIPLVLLMALAGFRIADLVSNRYYLQSPTRLSLFGSGLSDWFPQDAMSFLVRQSLPLNIYNEYGLGGAAAWSLSPTYPDYIDGRAVPFGGELFFRSLQLLQESADSPLWQREADSRNINTVVLSLDRIIGRGATNLRSFCSSEGWRAVYLDTRAAVFVRNRPENATLIGELQVDCDRVRFDAPPTIPGIRGDAERFLYHLNAAGIFLALGRQSEAWRQLDSAEKLFADNSDTHYMKGVLLAQAARTSDAERELLLSLELEPTEQASMSLAALYRDTGQHRRAAEVLEQAADRYPNPFQFHFALGTIKQDLGLPEQALQYFDRAEQESPYVGEAVQLGADFAASLAQNRAAAWYSLADSYEARGLRAEAQRAREHAASFSSNSVDTDH